MTRTLSLTKWRVAAAAIALPLLGSNAAFAAKIWELKDPITRTAGSATVSLVRVPLADKPKHFAALASDSRTPFVLVRFRGTCSPVAAVEMLVTHESKYDFSGFVSSGSGRDLPLLGALQELRRSLAEQCPELAVMRLTFKHTFRQQNIHYEGTMTQAAGWSLSDGNLPTDFDNSALVEIRMEDLRGRATTRHSGRCESQPTLVLRQTGPRGATDPTDLILGYRELAQAAAERYSEQCRATKVIRFALDPMPDSYTCAGAGDCFLEASATSPTLWSVGSRQLALKDINRAIASFDDVIEVLAAGRFDILADYRSFFSYFVDSYFESYFRHCADQIRNPVSRNRPSVVTETKDGFGNVLRTEVSPPSTLSVEKDQAWAYDAHTGSGRQFILSYGLRFALSAPTTASNTVRNLASILQSNSSQLARLHSSCRGDLALAVEVNMLKFAGGQEPVVGRFTTNKKRDVQYASGVSSAPDYLNSLRLGGPAGGIPTTSSPSAALESVPPQATAPSAEASAVPVTGRAELERQQAEEMAQLDEEYRQQIGRAGNAFDRLKLQAEFKLKKTRLELRHSRQLKQAP